MNFPESSILNGSGKENTSSKTSNNFGVKVQAMAYHQNSLTSGTEKLHFDPTHLSPECGFDIETIILPTSLRASR